MSTANLGLRTITQNVSRIEKLKDRNQKRLESTGEIEHLFISIYRINFSSLSRKILMRDFIFHLNNPDKVDSKVQLIERFSTIYNNRILGLEVQDASVYGSKIQLAFDDFDKKLSKTIRQNDVIVIHRINNKKLRQLDALASAFGLATESPSGIREGKVASGISSALKRGLLTNRVENKIIRATDEFLNKEKPIFSGLITHPELVMGSSIKLTIEAQDMVRILQHINTEEHESGSLTGVPTNLDDFLIKLDLADDSKIEIKGDDHIKIIKSHILNTLARAVMEDIKSRSSFNVLTKNRIKFIDQDLSTIRKIKLHDRIFIRPISNGMYLIHISPLRAIKLFVRYYTKNTGINVFFDVNTWDTDFFGDKEIIEGIYDKIYKNPVTGFDPYFTFGIILNINDDNIIEYSDNIVSQNDGKIMFEDIFKKFELKNVFTEETFDIIRRHRINESVVLTYLNTGQEDNYEKVISEFFLHLIRPSNFENIGELDTALLPNGENVFKQSTSGNAFIVSRNARQVYQDKLNEMRNQFSSTISLDYIIHTNYSSVRSVEYNSLLTNQMKSVPITQIIQLFLGAMTVIPVSQSKETTGFDNTAHNISQRMFLSSAIGFSNKSNKIESWVWKEGKGKSRLKPTIYFGLNYKPSYDYDEKEEINEATYLSDKELINAQMYTLPDNGNLSIYSWTTSEIQIGYSRFNEDDFKKDSARIKTPLSLGMTNVFDLFNITGKIETYLSENTEQQVGSENTPLTFPRVGLFTLKKRVGVSTHASTALARFDQFNEIPIQKTPYSIYLGYDMYGMNNDGRIIKLKDAEDLVMHLPVFDAGEAKLFETGSLANTVVVSPLDPVEAFGIFALRDGDNFPADQSVQFIKDNTTSIVTGIQKFYDPTRLLPILRAYSHFIKFGFKGTSGEGDNDWYDNSKIFQIYHNIQFKDNPDPLYLDTFKLIDDEGETTPAIKTNVKSLINALIKWAKQFEGNEQNKRKMMIKYAHTISGIKITDFKGDDSPLSSHGNDTFLHPPNFMSKINTIEDFSNPKAKKTMEIAVGVIRSLAHYMNRVAKESTTGGVLYMPIKPKRDGEIFKIGDAITFQEDDIVDERFLKKFLRTITIVDNPKTDLDLYRKIYYVWKITYYFGGAGTDPSGTSGNTMRVYITDSGIHWQSSYEEADITTKIAESMQLHKLSVGTLP